ncbi:MAG: bile acid:sodium symporter [Actinobacteria bacterium]|nr:bile acid:sodium symporter [Actinomycetota bacterium]
MQDSIVTSVALPAALAAIMATLGLSLTIADFRRIAAQPRGVFIGMANLLVISPLLAFSIAELLGLPALLAVGLVLLGASPGGTMANFLTHLARGSTALSVTITAVSSVCALVVVPLYLSLAIDRFDADLATEFEMLPIVAKVFAITTVPLAIGMAVRAKRTAWALANEERAKRLALGLFVGVVVAAIATEFDVVRDNFAEVAAATFLLNVLAMTISFFVSKAARLDNRQATAVALELGIHNNALAIAIATPIDPELAVPAAVYASFMFITGGAFARLMSRRNAAPGTPA